MAGCDSLVAVIYIGGEVNGEELFK